MNRILSVLALTLAFLAGCAGHSSPPPLVEIAPPPVLLTPAEEPPSNGSLWSQGQGGLFSDLKARNVGDILTVAIYERASASKEATTATGRDSSASADLSKLFGLESNIANISQAIDPSALISAGYKNDFKGSGSTTRKEDLVATLTTRVIAVEPNGNLRIAGSKTVRVNNEDQLISLEGMVRPADISADNFIDSKYILDARIAYTGKGVISDKQSQGWLVRVLDKIWPF